MKKMILSLVMLHTLLFSFDNTTAKGWLDSITKNSIGQYKFDQLEKYPDDYKDESYRGVITVKKFNFNDYNNNDKFTKTSIISFNTEKIYNYNIDFKDVIQLVKKLGLKKQEHKNGRWLWTRKTNSSMCGMLFHKHKNKFAYECHIILNP